MTIRSLLFSPGTDDSESTVLVFQYTTVTLWLIQIVSSLFRKLRLAPIHRIKAKHLSLAFKVPKKKKRKKRNPKKDPYSLVAKPIHLIIMQPWKERTIWPLKDEKDEAQRG